jgi:hypothetical protein
MLRGPSLAFRMWFHGCGAREACPAINFLQCMIDPLALPVFNRRLTPEHKFDLLFGRATLLLGLDWDKFVELGKEGGISFRWIARREAARMRRGIAMKGEVCLDDKVLVAEKGDTQMTVHDGTLGRMLFHGLSPRSAIGMMARSLEEVRSRPSEDGGV